MDQSTRDALAAAQAAMIDRGADSVTRDAECENCGGDGSGYSADHVFAQVGTETYCSARDMQHGSVIRCDYCGLYYKLTPDGLIPSDPWAEEGK